VDIWAFLNILAALIISH